MLTWLMVKIKYHFHVTCMATYVASFCPISIEILDWQILRRCWFFFVLFQLTPKYKFSWYYFFYHLKKKLKAAVEKKKKTQYLIKNNQTKIVETKQTIRWVFFSSCSSDWIWWLLLRLETTEYRPMTRILLHGLVMVRTTCLFGSLPLFSAFVLFLFNFYIFYFSLPFYSLWTHI